MVLSHVSDVPDLPRHPSARKTASDSVTTGKVARSLVAGLDLGSTNTKVMVTDTSGNEIVTAHVPTPWRPGAQGVTEMEAAALVHAVHRVLADASRALAIQTDATVGAIAISGMGESGILINAAHQPATPAIAWFDPRGAEQAAAFPDWIRAEFHGRTGLPLGAQVSVAKLAYLHDRGLDLSALRWLNLPEFIAMSLGGVVAVERSLVARTGLLDLDSGQPWTDLLKHIGADDSLLPPIVDAGADFGRATASDVPAAFAGARLTVAGHDHLVAAEASGPLSSETYHVSMGTAEVLLRVIDGPLGYEARARLVEHLINEVPHVVPGKHILVAGVKSGLLLRRVLQLVGIQDRAGRNELDRAVMALPLEGTLGTGSVEVSGARNDDGVLRVTAHVDGVTPAELFAAALRHSNEEIAVLIDAMDRELPPATSSSLTGGWVGMAAVRRARQDVLPAMAVSQREQETAYGAALAAIRLLNLPAPTTADRPEASTRND